jgi:hypothetical protein
MDVVDDKFPVTIFYECGGGVNLDCEDEKDLMEFWFLAHSCPVKVARRVFPAKPAFYVQASNDLAAYASNKATAMSCRRRGDITAAQLYESICDRVYAELPEFARW